MLSVTQALKNWLNASSAASNLSDIELLIGEVTAAVVSAEQSVTYADQCGDESLLIIGRTTYADALHAAGRHDEAEDLFAHAENRQKKRQPNYPLLYSVQGYQCCDLLLSKGRFAAAQERATRVLEWGRSQNALRSIALSALSIGRVRLGHALMAQRASAVTNDEDRVSMARLDEELRAALAQRGVMVGDMRVGEMLLKIMIRDDACVAQARLSDAVEGLHTAGMLEFIPLGLLARAILRRIVGDWDGAARDLDEVEEIAEPGPMRLYLCDMALERARLAFARINAFAPLNGLIDNGPPSPVPRLADESAKLTQEARENLATARALIARCGYHKRDEELAELEAVRDGHRRFADLPPRV